MATDTNINNTTLNSMNNNIDNDRAAFFYYGIKDDVDLIRANLAPDDFEMSLRFLVHDIEGRLMTIINSKHNISLAVFLFRVYRLMRKRFVGK
jgi:hypothetical protein